MRAGADDLPLDPAAVRLGERIRAAREDRFSVHELSKAAGVSAGLVSKIEQGRGNPSFKTLQRLATALDLQIGALVEAASVEPDRSMVVRRSERTQIQIGSHGPSYELLTPNLRGQLEVLETTIPSGFDNHTHPFTHDGEECIVVQTGRVTIEVDGQCFDLQPGDAITYDATKPHWWRNQSDESVVIIGIVTPPSF
jgi:transcriptional regulator with XRE-family HTH domain